MNHVWNDNEKLLFFILAMAAAIAILVGVMLVLDWIREDRETREWRGRLKRGDRVRVEGMEEVQLIWNVDGEDAVVRVFTEGGDWFKKVRLDSIWPEEYGQEWEIVNE